jgi:hypothetical protein
VRRKESQRQEERESERDGCTEGESVRVRESERAREGREEGERDTRTLARTRTDGASCARMHMQAHHARVHRAHATETLPPPASFGFRL